MGVLALLVALACGCAAGSSVQPSMGIGGSGVAPGKTLVLVTRVEPESLSLKVSPSGGLSANDAVGVFNAGLVLFDGQMTPSPHLAEALPRLGTDTWRVFDDGRMETIYRLRSGLTWHDGAPLTAEDFVFGWRVYLNPMIGWFRPVPQHLVEDMQAPDSQTLVIRWRQAYPEAGELAPSSLPPMPKHLLAQAFEGPYRPLVAHDGQPDAGARRLSFHQHGARAAGAVLAAEMGRGEATAIAQKVGQRLTRLNVVGDPDPIQFDDDLGHCARMSRAARRMVAVCIRRW